jgi:hypothetical protein
MDIDKGDEITLDDNESYYIISKVNYEGFDYLYAINVKNNGKLKILRVKGDTLAEFNNPELLKNLLPLLKDNAIDPDNV